MAGHAPELLSPSRRLLRWLLDLSDVRISAYMLAMALFITALLYILDRQFFR